MNKDSPEYLRVREEIAELVLQYLTLCKARDDYSPAIIESELTPQILAIKGLAILSDEQGLPPLLQKRGEYKEFKEKDLLRRLDSSNFKRVI